MLLLNQTQDLKLINVIARDIAKICDTDSDCYANVEKLLKNDKALKKLYLEYHYGFHLKQNGNFEASNKTNKINAKIAKKLELHNLSSDYNLNIGINYHKLLQADSALYYLIEATKDLESVENDYRLWIINFTLAEVYGLIDDKINQEKHLIDSYKIAKDKDVRMDLGYVLYHVLQFYKVNGPVIKFNEYLETYLEFLKGRSHDSKHQAILSLFVDEQEAINKFETYLNSTEGLNYKKYGRCNLSAELGHLYFKNKSYKKAQEYLEHVSNNCQDFNMDQLLSIGESLIYIYKHEGNYAQATATYDKLIALRDSIGKKEKINAVYEMKEKYESEKKDKLILSQQLIAQRSEMKLWALGAGFLILCGIMIWAYGYAQQKRKKEIFIQEQRFKELELQNDIIAFEAMLQGEEKERTRLSRELHDGIGALLTNIKARFQLFKAGEVSQDQIDKTSAMIDKTYTEVRRVSHNLMPNSLQLLGLKGAIEDLANDNFKIDLNFETIIEGLNEEHLDNNKSLIIFRIIQELVANAIKHSTCHQILIQLIEDEETLSISVEDDGKGFDLNRKSNGLGLENIKSRVKYLKGELDIDSKPRIGTSFNIIFQIENLRKHDQRIYH